MVDGVQMDKNNLFHMNIRIAEDMITLAMFLKIDQLQKNLINFCIIPNINRENAVKYALYAVLHIQYLFDQQDAYDARNVER